MKVRLTNLSGVVDGAKYELWGSIITGTYVRYVGLPLDQVFSGAKVTQFEHTSVRIQKEVLGLDVPVTYP